MTTRAQIWLIFGLSFLNFFAMASVRALVPLYARSTGLSVSTIGLVLAGYSLLALVFAIPAGSMVDRYGVKPILMVSSASLSLGWLLVAIWPTPLAFFLSQILAGIGQLLAGLACQTGLSVLCRPERLEENFAHLSIASSLGELLGPLLGGPVSDHFGYAPAFYVGAASGLTIALAAALLRPVRTAAGGRRFSLRQEARGIGALLTNDAFRIALIACFIALFVQTTRSSILPLFLSSTGLSNTSISLLLSLQSAAALLVRPLIAGGVQWFGRFWLLVASLAATCLSLVGYPLFDGDWLWLLLMAVLMGSGFGIAQPLTMAIACDASPPHQRGLALGLRQIGNRAGQLANPVLLGLLADAWGFTAAMVSAGLALGLALVPVFTFRRGLVWPKDLPARARRALPR